MTCLYKIVMYVICQNKVYIPYTPCTSVRYDVCTTHFTQEMATHTGSNITIYPHISQIQLCIDTDVQSQNVCIWQNYVWPWLFIYVNSTALLHLKVVESTGMYVCIYICIHISVPKTLATYSNCMVIFRLHNTLTETPTLSVCPWHPRVVNDSHFRASSPVCTLPTAITRVITVQELGSLMWIPIALGMWDYEVPVL